MQRLTPVEEARETVLSFIETGPIEKVELLESLGRTLADDLASDIDIAPFDNTAMDGFALRSTDIAAADEQTPISLPIIAHIGAGATFDGTVEAGQAVRIMTGAPIPTGCDTVVKIEIVELSGTGDVGDTATFRAPSDVGRNIRRAGEECHRGDVVMHRGDVVSPAAIGLLAATGHATVPVYVRPQVGIISLGSELVEPDEKPGPGQIRNSNAATLAAQAIAAGAVPHVYPTAADDERTITDLIAQAASECDLVISSGGASNGDYDYITLAVEKLGTMYFKYLNMRPGKSQPFAMIDGTPFFGLAGNPSAAVVGFEMLVRPALRRMQGLSELERPLMRARLTAEVRKKRDPRRYYLRGHLVRTPEGDLTVTPVANQSSALIGTFAQSNCLLVVPEGLDSLAAGTVVDCVRFDIDEGTVI